MGIRQPPSGTLEACFLHGGASFAATYPTREDAEDAEPLLRTAALAGPQSEPEADRDTIGGAPPTGPPPDPPPTPTPDQVRHSSAAAAPLINTILARGHRQGGGPSAGTRRGTHGRPGRRAARRVPPDPGRLAPSRPDPVPLARYPPAFPPLRRPRLPRPDPPERRRTRSAGRCPRTRPFHPSARTPGSRRGRAIRRPGTSEGERSATALVRKPSYTPFRPVPDRGPPSIQGPRHRAPTCRVLPWLESSWQAVDRMDRHGDIQRGCALVG